MSEIEVYVPLTEYLPEDAWPSDLIAPPGGGLLDAVAYEGGTFIAEEGFLSAEVALRVIEQQVLELPGGLAVVVGDGPVTGALQAEPEGFTASVYGEVLRLRLPRSLFVPVMEEEGEYRADPDPERFVEIPLPFGVSLDELGNLDFLWPGSGPGTLSLPRFMIGTSGIVLSAEGILIRLSDNQPLPDGAEEIGLDPDWRGIYVRRAEIHLPRQLRGKVAPIHVSLRLGLARTDTGEAAFDVGITVGAFVAEPIPLGETGVAIESGEIEVSLSTNGPHPIGDLEFWKRLIGNSRLTVTGFRTTGSVIPGGALSGDLQIVLADGELDTDQSYLKRYEPDDQHLAELGIKHVSVGSDHLAVTWDEPRINHWLRQIAPGLADDAEPATHELTLRALFGGGALREIRFEWQIDGAARKLKLPGVDVTTPDRVRVSMLLGAGGQAMSRLALALTFDRESSPLVAASSFAWDRGGDRELQNDAERPAEQKPLFELTLGIHPERAQAVTLVLLEMDVAELGLPRFLRQLQEPLAPLDYADRDRLTSPTPWNPESLGADRWKAEFRINADQVPFELPFLKQEESRPEDGQFPQVLRVDRPRLDEVKVDFAAHTVTVPVGITLDLGSIDFATDVELGFNWERFALAVDHEAGIEMVSEKPAFEPSEPHLGLLWSLRGAPITQGPRAGKFSYFTLVTRNHDYQVVQTPGAAFQVAYTGISDEPITFTVSDFAVTSRGVSLNAVVTDQPAKINGIDTRFRFNDTRIEVRDNRIADFTLSGSGPLPPALVGDATADLSLQFGVRDGGLRLLAGGARLRGSKTLESKGTRFRFSVDALGVKFVHDGRFHLYFTLTGSAEFVPAQGDDADGPLALLGKIRIDLVEAPLTGDARVLAKHVRFLVELPKPKSFNFLGAFEMELRGIGFVPSADVFGGDPAMMLTGQLKFAQGAGDAPDSRTDVHTLYIGLPKPGTFIPRIHFKNLPVHINFGAAFRLNGTVEFVDTPQEKGFTGEGVLQIQGLPTIAASFAFLRVRRDENSPWVRAWFIYIEARQVSFPIPVVQLYLREIGLGFGYRYTLVAIKAADQENDVRKLLASLKTISKTQGDLSKRDRWAVDLEDPGQDPRWTIVLRALISQTSASPSPLQWNEAAERDLVCTFLFDAVIAFRSDLTFLMSVRAWLNANYYDYVSDYKGLRSKPLLNGFVLLSPRQKRLLANLSSNPGGQLGAHPPLPDFVQKALTSAQFTATLLVEPGLLHYELGWPNMLRWSTKVGPLNADFRGGFIFRVSKRELVTGASFLARASLQFQAGLDLGIVGARVSASASLAYGARYIGVVDFANPAGNSALYAGVGIEVHVKVSVEFWIKLKLGFVKITKTFRFSLNIDFTAGLEVGFAGLSSDGIGLRGHGTLAVKCMGRSLQLSVKIGLNEGAVTRAKARTEKYLNIGLEANDVEGIPGVDAQRSLPAPQPLAAGFAAPLATRAREPLFATSARTSGLASAVAERTVAGAQPSPRFAFRTPEEVLAAAIADVEADRFETPDYSVFVVRLPRRADGEEEAYFVLLPQGERVDGDTASPENGFLPPPPAGGGEPGDFALEVPAGGRYTLRQWDPAAGAWTERPVGGRFGWSARWDTPVALAEEHVLDGDAPTGQVHPEVPLTLADYLVHAYLTREEDDGEGGVRRVAHADPDPLPATVGVVDERVHNPSDEAFEAAVRGVVEQFGGAPFLRRGYVRDASGNVVPAHEYERALDLAFNDATTIYTAEGTVPSDPAAALRMQQNQQAQQLRGMVVHDLVSDLREYAEAAAGGAAPAAPEGSTAFAMGLVFHVRGSELPEWLERVPDDTAAPRLRQRRAPGDAGVCDEARPVRTFNVRRTDFSLNPPQFQRVQQLADASTIAITWDLVWERAPEGIRTASQADPEEHLLHYQVRRRALSGTEREAVFTVKPADALNRPAGEGGLLQALRPRFQLVDHFTHETPEELAALPAEGRSYLYTITPYDFAGNPGRPLTVVATRFPNEPPVVPTDAELVVTYRLDREILEPAAATEPAEPRAVSPAEVHVEWSEPAAAPGAPVVPVDRHVLVFRRDATLPIGSYGLDGSTQGPRSKRLPTSNARSLPTDVRLDVEPGPAEPAAGGRRVRTARVPLEELRRRGVLPGEGGAWRPESWRVFVQTVSLGGVPSALAPVQLLLRAEPAVEVGGPGAAGRAVEERRPAELEWLPTPMRFPVLPPEDERAVPGVAHVPMPRAAGSLRFTGAALPEAVGYQTHPRERRCIRFRWNQGPSGNSDYPLDLNAGFHLLELDVDAHTADTFQDAGKLAGALRTLQEVQMVPAADLLLTPGDTLATGQWEAWYPSAVRRLRAPEERAEGSEIPLAPWLSWRESMLAWPRWDGLTDAGVRTHAVHPFLRRILSALDENPEGLQARGAPLPTFNLDLQVTPPIAPGSLADFLRATAPADDPYGWGVLQRFGLSVTLSLRDEQTGDVVPGPRLVQALADVLAALEGDATLAEYAPHLHVELLFQPGRSISLESAGADADGLLAMAQLSLRPTPVQSLGYAAMELRGPAGASVDLAFALEGGTTCTLVDQNDPASGQVELEAPAGPAVVARTIRLPASGETRLLLRGERIPTVGVLLRKAPADAAALAELGAWLRYEVVEALHRVVLLRPLAELTPERRDRLRAALDDTAAFEGLFRIVTVPAPFAATDELSTYFTVPAALPARFGGGAAADAEQWLRFVRYAESLASTDPTLPEEMKIRVPRMGTALEAVLPEYLAWSQRFFDYGGDVAQDAATGRAVAQAGPWLATAYPRAGSPAYTTPDAGGRLTYDHLLEDRWAHSFRYFVRPFGRYDLLWQSFRQSPALGGGLPRLEPAAPDPQAGGLDVVLDRTQPVAMPLVLASRRLDPPTTPQSPAAPGTTWEVLVAQHPEQALAEKNSTLARQLAFQQVAFTLLRRFAYPEWTERLSALVGSEVEVRPVEDVHPDLPASYPAAPDHLDLSEPLRDETARRLDVPLRTGGFHQGAMALQWDALPFFYEHRLLLAAQSASTVSRVNEVVQRDFEYRTPDPSASVGGAVQAWTPAPPFGEGAEGALPVRARELRVPLRRFWDSLPPAAQAQWDAEAPDDPGSPEPRRKPASLPDPEVVYQVVETFTGNVEVQAELFWDTATGRYATRQLGRRFLVDVSAVDAPPAAAPQSDFVLRAVLQPVAEEPLTRAVDPRFLPEAVRPRMVLEGKKMFFAGTLTRADRDALLAATDAAGEPLFVGADRAAIERVYLEGFSEEVVSRAVAVPAGMEDRVEVRAAEDALVWAGPLSDADRDALLALPGDAEFRGAVERLVAAVEPGRAAARVPLVPGAEPKPEGLEALELVTDDAGATYTALRWTGPLPDGRVELLERWPRIRALGEAVESLVRAGDGAVATVELLEGATPPETIPDVLRAGLVVSPGALSWRGRVRSPAQLDALVELGDDEAFRAAALALAQALAEARIQVGLALPVRPTQETLPAGVRERLTLGRAALHYHGVMSSGDAAALRGLFSEAADRGAVQRLAAATLRAGMRGRELRIRARRGSAAPSALNPIDPQSL